MPGGAVIERLAAGDQNALADLYDGYGRSVYALACRIVTDRTEAEDVVQEVFAQAWRHAARYDPSRATVIGWLLMMTRARAIDRLRARKVRPVAADTAMPDLADQAPGQEATTISDEQARRLGAALGQLPEPQRAAIELAYYEGLSQSDIAERLREPLGTVKTRMRSALQKLRVALQDGGAR
jgi:RNA polymerase sigma-70 factor (ECF subfamily)